MECALTPGVNLSYQQASLHQIHYPQPSQRLHKGFPHLCEMTQIYCAMLGIKYYLTCYLGSITIKERYEQHYYVSQGNEFV